MKKLSRTELNEMNRNFYKQPIHRKDCPCFDCYSEEANKELDRQIHLSHKEIKFQVYDKA